MVYAIERITRDVRVVMDENHDTNALIREDDDDTLQMEHIVRDTIETAARAVTANAPVFLLDTHTLDTSGVKADGNGVATVHLPGDFMRTVSVRMADWERASQECILPSHPFYRLQDSRCRGLRGNKQKPVVRIAMTSAGKVAELYSSAKDTPLEKFMYCPLPTMAGGKIDISERLYPLVVYKAAALVCASYGMTDRMNYYTALSQDYDI